MSPASRALSRSDVRAINFSWLLRLRWGAAIGQLATIFWVHFGMEIPLDLVPLVALVGLTIVSNLAAYRWLDRETIGERAIVGLMTLDVLVLTGLLYLTGGPYNPFSFLYLVHIALATVVLRSPWTWTLAGLSLVCFAALFLGHEPLGVHDPSPPPPSESHALAPHHDHGAHDHVHPQGVHDPSHSHGAEVSHDMRLHVEGMWVAFGVAAAFIVYFVHRVTLALSQREEELAQARQKNEQHERLASLATLAAGAAHELSTPLSTIAVVAKELERRLSRGTETEAADDARLIREQVERCRTILEQMAADVGEHVGESLVRVDAEALVTQALASMEDSSRIRVEIDPGEPRLLVRTAPRAVGQALRSLLKNALDASEQAPITLRARREGAALRLEVEDRGTGMSPDVLARAAEPFFTTKAPGRGMGLGLFLARVVVERLGGRLEVESVLGQGTRAAILLPGEAPADDRMTVQEEAFA